METIESSKEFLDIDYMLNIHKLMSEKNLILVYRGELNQDLTKTFTSMAKKNLEDREVEKNVKKKVFNIMVECLQNIYKHSANLENTKHLPLSIFAVGKHNELYAILSGNLIENEKVEGLRSFIEHINSLDKEALSEFFQQKLLEGTISEKGGAGLGLIDIAKKSGQKLDYKFVPVDDKYSYFCLRTTILTDKPKQE